MVIRIISYSVGLTATLLVAALAGGTAWAAVSPAPISSVHAQVRLVAQPPGDTNCDDTSSGQTDSKNKTKDKTKDKTSKDTTSKGSIRSFRAMPCDSKSSCGMDSKGMQKPCGNSNGGNGTKSSDVCDSGFNLMTIDAMLRSVAAPGTARELKAADKNRDNHLCVKLSADGHSMTRFVDNNRAV
jgi:hypothetical protein